METQLTEELIEKTYLYCWKRVTNKDDARDIAQEIIIDAMLVLRSGKKIENFYGLYWSIASHKVTDFYRRKKPANISLDDVENVLLGFDKSIGDYIHQEEIDILTKSINQLACSHRDILVRFYVKSQSVKEIALALSIPVGTVTRRLSDARKKLQENFENMENQKENDKNIHIEDFSLGFVGDSYNAGKNISSLLEKQILFSCKDKAKSINEIAKEIDVAPLYIEKTIPRLISADVLFEAEKGKFLTDFVFVPNKAINEAKCLAVEIAKKNKLDEKFVNILLEMKEELLNEDFYGNDLGWEYLLPYFIIRADREFRKVVGGDYIRETYVKERYDRIYRNFFVIGYYGDKGDNLPDEKNNIITPGYTFYPFYNAKYGKFEVHNTIEGMKYSKDGKDYELTNERLDWINDVNYPLYKKIADNPNAEITKDEEIYLAEFISNGVVIKTKEGFKGTVPLIPFKLVEKWCKKWNEKLREISIEFLEEVYQSQKNIVLPYIRKDLMLASTYSFFPVTIDVDSFFIKYAIDNNLVHFEEGVNNSCAALVVLIE